MFNCLKEDYLKHKRYERIDFKYEVFKQQQRL